ncbi:hypothetical protein C8J56DRAFT_1052741 [Mycena floridula]|nr:hypothetical protein C8J56DRAFT_1052741 [Mycena floridula]
MEAGPVAGLAQSPLKESNSTILIRQLHSGPREAKIFDNSMVVRWKVTMDGLVLFAALFSAVMTAFIIESYRTVARFQRRDDLFCSIKCPNSSLPSEIAPRLHPFSSLSSTCRHSQHLEAPFSPTSSGSSQWASDYIHAIESRQAPEKRARIRSFLFEGEFERRGNCGRSAAALTYFAVLLSHWLGLFMRPVNSAITLLLAVILGTCAAAYIFSTIIPIVVIASPIRTPLTMFLLKFSFIRNVIRRGLRTIWEIMMTLGVSEVAVPIWKKIRRGMVRFWEQVVVVVPFFGGIFIIGALEPTWGHIPEKIAKLLETSDSVFLLPPRERGTNIQKPKTLPRQLKWTFQPRFLDNDRRAGVFAYPAPTALSKLWCGKILGTACKWFQDISTHWPFWLLAPIRYNEFTLQSCIR